MSAVVTVVCVCGHTQRHHSGNSYAGRCCVKPCACKRFKPAESDR